MECASPKEHKSIAVSSYSVPRRSIEMGLVYCPECGTKASDKASVCPFCGFRSSTKNMPMIASKKPLKNIQWESSSLASEFDQVFPISTIQNNNLNIIFSRAENLGGMSRVV